MSATKGRGFFESHARVSSKLHKTISHEDKLTFLQQLATLLNAGTPLLESPAPGCRPESEPPFAECHPQRGVQGGFG